MRLKPEIVLHFKPLAEAQRQWKGKIQVNSSPSLLRDGLISKAKSASAKNILKIFKSDFPMRQLHQLLIAIKNYYLDPLVL